MPCFLQNCYDDTGQVRCWEKWIELSLCFGLHKKIWVIKKLYTFIVVNSLSHSFCYYFLRYAAEYSRIDGLPIYTFFKEKQYGGKI